MILFGGLQERDERPGSGGWLPLVLGCVAGVVPWLAIAIFLSSPGSTSSASPPGFVYAIFGSSFVFFSVFSPQSVAAVSGHGGGGRTICSARRSASR